MAKRKRKPKQRYDLDIVIPVYGRPDLLEKCVTSIEETIGEVRANLILVDDKGPDPEGTAKIYRSLNGSHRVIYHSENQGFARTVNDGVKSGNAPLVLILNTDIELKAGCIQAMITEFNDARVGAVGAKLLFPEDSTDPQRPEGAIQHAGLAVDFGGQIIHANIGWDAGHPKVNERRVCQAVTGACLMTRREVWRRVHAAYKTNNDPTTGAFNEVYGKGTYEDVEYCFAVRSLDYEVIYTPLAEAYHHVGGSVLQNDGAYPLQRNEMIFRARCGTLLIWDEWRFL